MNLPNKLTILRIFLVPVFMIVMMAPIPFISTNDAVCRIVAFAIFVLTSLTDMLDGKIARKYNIVTNFGKIMDPLADKALVFSAFLMLAVNIEALDSIMIWACVIVFIRELGVTSIRLVCASNAGNVIAANFFGKAKTVTQMACILVVLVENGLIASGTIDLGAFNYLASFILIIAMSFMTVASGINYLKIYMPYMNSNK